MSDLYDLPITLEEGILIHDCLLELKHTYYVGMKHFTVEKKDMLDSLIETLGTWINNRSIE